MNRDLTVGEPRRVLRSFCLPLLGSIIFQQLYNLADSFVAGRFIGENALAAVGNSYEITLIFLAISFGCSIGSSVTVSRLFGAGEHRQLKTAVSTVTLFCAAICAAMMLLGLLLGRQLLALIRTPELLMADSALYLDIYVWGLPFLMFYNIATGIFSALGDSNTPFRFLAVSSTANIAMDVFFVCSLHMGVAGVAWATFLCQGVSCVLAVLAVVRRLESMPTVGRVPLFERVLLRDFLAIAIPSILQQSSISVGNIIIQGAINGFGPAVIAGYAASVKLNNLVITGFTTLGNGVSNFSAQNLGANKLDRLRSGFRAGIRLVWTLALPMCLIYFFGGRVLLGVFMQEPSAQAMATGVLFLRILAPFYFVVSAKLVSDGVLRGTGCMRPFMIGTFTDLILRVVLALLLSRTALGSVGIWCAWPIGWTTATVISLLCYRAEPWRKRSIL